MSEPTEAIYQLRNHQQQADMDGVLVTVSRQALDELLDYFATRQTNPADLIEGARLMRGAAEAAFKRDAELCDCFAREEGECACGAWDGYKSIYVDRAVEIILALDPASVVGE